MIHSLRIKNIALIEDLTLYFGPGLNVLTGETGAGKSVILEALELALGKRATVDYIRTGEEKAVIEAVFTVKVTPGCLIPAGIQAEEGCLVFQRELYRQGRSLSRINGQAVPLSLCREAAVELIDFLVQGEQREIYLSSKQMEMLDAFAGLSKQRVELARLYQNWRSAKERIELLKSIRSERLRRMDTLRYQIEEIDRAEFREGEIEGLLKERQWLQNVERIVELAARGQALLGGQEQSAVEMVGQAAAVVKEIARYQDSLQPCAEGLEVATQLITEATRELERLVDRAEYDPRRADAVEARLELFERLRRKYGDNVGEILRYREEAAKELLHLEQGEEDTGRLQSEVERLGLEWESVAIELQEARKDSATRLENEIVRELGNLAMEQTLFRVVFKPVSEVPNPYGLHEVEFHFAPNPGEPMKPLTSTASGGEAARTVFALKVLTAANDRVETLFLDEVDTGISGQALEAIATRLERIAKHRQIICITHQALVAGRADTHHLIMKQVKGSRTVIRVVSLEGEARIRELARLVGGSPDTAREHAQRLLENR